MHALVGLFPTSGEKFMPIAMLEIYFLRKMLLLLTTILIFPTVCYHIAVTHTHTLLPAERVYGHTGHMSGL